jgi:hypothetical protein
MVLLECTAAGLATCTVTHVRNYPPPAKWWPVTGPRRRWSGWAAPPNSMSIRGPRAAN